jgi:hypothetical protein
LRTVYGKLAGLQQGLCKAALTGGVVATQVVWQEQHGSSYDQQPVYTSMAGEDGSLVMLGEPLATDGDEALQPKHQEPFVLLDGIPQVLLAPPAALLFLRIADVMGLSPWPAFCCI